MNPQGEGNSVSTSDAPIVDAFEFFRNQPSLDEVAEYVTLNLLGEYSAIATVISSIESDGTLRLAGSFGVDRDQRARMSRVPLGEEHCLMCAALRKGGPLIVHGSDEEAQSYPGLRLNHPGAVQIALPLDLPHRRVGAMTVVFDKDGRVDTCLEGLRQFADAVSLYLALCTPAHQGSDRGDGHGELSPNRSAGRRDPGTGFTMADWEAMDPVAATVQGLTERQMQVLRLMAENMTNSQIATRIGYSDSTVRQETMAIYRYLSVADRHEAVRVALSRGILTPEHSRAG